MILRNEVLNDSVDFLKYQEDELELLEAIIEDKEWDYNEIDSLDEYWHSEIVDRAYTLSDAAVVIENCENEETDSGLWETQQPEDAIKTKAAYSYGMDCWFKTEEIFTYMKDEYQELIKDFSEEDLEDDEKLKRASKIAFDDVLENYLPTVKPVEKGSEDEKDLIEQWIRMSREVGMRGGGPAGSSYIDARCGTGLGQPDQMDYINFDHRFVKCVPHLQGKYIGDIEKYYNETHKKSETTPKAKNPSEEP